MNRHVLERVGVLCAVLTVAAFVVPGSGQALASNVSCGATITTNTKLDSDLTNCPSNGIVIGADNITLDLNGHTVGGDVRGFDIGISVRGNENRIQGVASANNSTFGMILADSTGSRIDHSSSVD